MKRVPICEEINKDNYNNGNLHEYDPYLIIDEVNIIDTDWWISLSEYNKELINMRLNGKYILGKVEIPHEVQVDNSDKFLSIVHQAYLDSFDYNIWYDKDPQNVSMIHISSKIKNILLEMYTNHTKVSEDFELQEFKDQISKVISTYTGGWFMRTSSTSGKNEDSLEPLYTANDVILRLTTIKLFVEKEYRRPEKDTYLILIPWNVDVELDPQYEFRIFVVNGKLTGACPQRWFDCYQYSEEELEKIEKSLMNLKFVDVYKTFIADVYITDECHLIEFNPFGAYCGAGSALFNWIKDYDVLYGKVEPELRYRSAISY